jgi:hypothetical protein
MTAAGGGGVRRGRPRGGGMEGAVPGVAEAAVARVEAVEADATVVVPGGAVGTIVDAVAPLDPLVPLLA